MLSAVGFILVLVMVVLIIRGKIALPPILILLPTIATIVLGLAGALSAGDGGPAAMSFLECLKTLKTYLDSGLKSVLNTACLFTFAVIF